MSPVELPTSNSYVGAPTAGSGHRRMSSGDRYYEDVDPRFAATDPQPNIPSSLTPAQRPLEANNSYDDLQEGARSPAASEASHFTSVSQRPVNPNWHPNPNDMMQMPPRRPAPRQQDVLLDSNPDFNFPGATRGGFRGRGRGRGGPSMSPSRAPGQIPGFGLGNDGRYPSPAI